MRTQSSVSTPATLCSALRAIWTPPALGVDFVKVYSCRESVRMWFLPTMRSRFWQIMREWWNSHRFVRAGSHRFVRKRFWQTLIVRMNSLRVCKHESPVDLFSKILVCVSFLHPKTGWWLRASDNSMLGPRDGSLKSQTLFLTPHNTHSSSCPNLGKHRNLFVESLLKIFLDMMERPQTTLSFLGRELHRLSSPRGKNLLLF